MQSIKMIIYMICVYLENVYNYFTKIDGCYHDVVYYGIVKGDYAR